MRFLVAFCLLIVVCTHVTNSDPSQDALLKNFKVDPDEAGIFIYRFETVSVITKLDEIAVGLDDAPLGKTYTKTYLYKTVQPGRHKITSYAENTDTLEVDVKLVSQVFIR